MEVVSVAVPPEAILEHAIRLSSGQAYWVREGAFSVRCEPQATDDTLKLVMPLSGSVLVGQGERRAALERGSFTWIDADRPFELACGPGTRHLQIRWPRAVIRQKHPALDATTAIPRGLGHPGERLLSGILSSFAQEGPSLSSGDSESAIAALLESLGMARQRTPEDILDERVLRAQRDVERSLHLQDLDAARIAQWQGVSRRYLDGLFEARYRETIAAYIRRRRLERAAERLRADPASAVEVIAQSLGFPNASHFSRVFRHHFACSPSAYRNKHLTTRS